MPTIFQYFKKVKKKLDAMEASTSFKVYIWTKTKVMCKNENTFICIIGFGVIFKEFVCYYIFLPVVKEKAASFGCGAAMDTAQSWRR